MAGKNLHVISELQSLDRQYGEQAAALLSTFAAEGHEICGKIERILSAPDQDLPSLQRNIHTLKGSAAQTGLVSLSHLIHETEDLLAPFASRRNLLFDGLAGPLVHYFSEFDALFLLLSRITMPLASEIVQECSRVEARIDLAFRSLYRDFQSASVNPSAYISGPSFSPNVIGALPAFDVEKYQLQRSTLDDLLQWLEKLLVELFRRRDDPSLSSSIRTLQQALLTLVRARTEPAHPLGHKVHHLAVETAHQLQKNVHFQASGFDTRLDSRMLSALSEALLHLIRNAIDHGIETPDERRQVGKPHEARLNLRIEQKADRTLVLITDDGRGIDPARVSAKAIAKGLLKAEDIAHFNDYERQELIFLPGFSTKDAVSEISGRGVGMDAVREAVERVKGKITVDSKVGQGTTFILTFPSFYIYEPMRIFRYGSGLYAISERYVLGTRAADQWQFDSGAMITSDSGELYPLLALPEIDPSARIEGERPALLLDLGGATYGLCCDEILPPRDIFMVPAANSLDANRPAYLKGGCIEDDLGVLQGIDLVEVELSINRYQFEADRATLGGVSDLSALRGGAGIISDRLESGLTFLERADLIAISDKEAALLSELDQECARTLQQGTTTAIQSLAQGLVELLDAGSGGISETARLRLEKLALRFLEALSKAA